MTDFTDMTNEQLEEQYDRLWRQRMYYMAAEGNWAAEAKERGQAEKEYWDCVTEMNSRNMKAPE